MRFRLWLLAFFLAAVPLARPTAAWSQDTVATADAVCTGCHATIARSYFATTSAHASGPARDHLISGEFLQPASSVRYTVVQQAGQSLLRFRDLRDQRITGEHSLDYFLGSGHLGVTYLYTQDGYLLESPVAWYAATRAYDMKPGFGALTEMPAALPMGPNCLRCHMSGVAHALPGTINRFAGLPFEQTGITCEGCHGNTAEHVRSRGRAPVLNPAKFTPERRDSVCMSCHLEGDVAVERQNKSALDFRPGDRLGDYLSFFVFASQDPLKRGVSEVEQLSASQCKRASGDRMACTSCHDPHATPTPEQRVAFYRSKCLACHTAPVFAQSHHSENPDCTSCHMPRSNAQDIPHVAWTDHRILRQPPAVAAPLTAPNETAGPLTPIFSPQASERDLAVAMYQAIVRGKAHDRDHALAKLRQVYADQAAAPLSRPDPQVLEGLGVLSGLGHTPQDAAESERYLRQLLALDPANLTAIADLGVLLARGGNIQAAVDLWMPAFARNQDILGLARNLAAGQCALGDTSGAETTIQSARRFSPGARSLWTPACTRKAE